VNNMKGIETEMLVLIVVLVAVLLVTILALRYGLIDLTKFAPR